MDADLDPPAPIAAWPRDRRGAIAGIFCDIDDTLTTDGRIGADVFAALERLRAAGVLVVPVTGRPAGWCDLIARQWPVDAVIGESGAFAFRHDPDSRRMIRSYALSSALREENRRRLAAVRDDILARVPGVAVAADQAYRETDLAIDVREDVLQPQSPETIETVLEIFRRHGATARLGSIHINGWFGDYDKVSMACRLMAEVYNVHLPSARAEYTFVGDSPNDAPMFEFFPDAVGVANLAEFRDRCATLPAWITAAAHGAGFVEAAEAVLAAR